MDIIVHAFPAWEGNYLKSTVELTKCLAQRGHRIIYVDYARTWTDVFREMRDKLLEMNGLRSSKAKNSPLITHHSSLIKVLKLPPVVPANFIKNARLHDAVNWFNSLFIGRKIRAAARAASFDNYLVINAFNPDFGSHLAGKLGERRLIYYCYDEIGAAAWASRHGARLEKVFVQKCDAVVVTSEGLRQKMAALHPSVFLVKNGVDFELFSQVYPRFEGVPSGENLPVIPGKKTGQKVIGYLGSIDDRLDYDLLEMLFEEFRGALFVFVGRANSSEIRAWLERFPNVFLAGPQPPETLPGWVQRMDVCLIPFVKNQFTANIYPLKINEYLAAGKPVVSTHFSELSDFQGIVSIVDKPEAFLENVSEALNALVAEAEILRRREFARKNSWLERAAELEKILKSNLIPNA